MIRILRTVIPARTAILALAETLAIVACFLLASWLDPDISDFTSFLQYDAGVWRILLVTGTIVTGLILRGLYSQVPRSAVAQLEELCVVFGITVIGQGLVDYALPGLTIPRKVMVGGGILSMVAIWVLRLLAGAPGKGAISTTKVLFLGYSPTVDVLVSAFLARPEYGWKPLGFLSTQRSGNGGHHLSSQVPCLGSMEDLDAVVETHGPQWIVIARRSDIKPKWTEEFLELRFGGVHVEEAAALYERTFGRVCIAEIWPHKLIFTDAFESAPLNRRLSVALSWAVTVLCLVPAIFLIPLIAVLLRLTSTGPTIRRERVSGIGNIPFVRHSFQCHRADGTETPIGSWLLRSGLYRLPGLFDVLVGKMALIGPRPDLQEYGNAIASAVPFYLQRQRVKPGLTGWQQIHASKGAETGSVPGRQDSDDVLSQLEFDLYYVRHVSVALDIAIIVRSVRRVLFGELRAA